MLILVQNSSAFAPDTLLGSALGTHNGSGTLFGPSNKIVFTAVAPLGVRTDLLKNGSWDTHGPGDTLKFTATYTVTQHDVDFLQ